MDARAKIVLTFVYIFAIFFCKNFFSLGVCILSLAAGVAVSGIKPSLLLKSLRSIMLIIIFTAVLNLFYISDGRVIFEFWKISITDKGVYTAIFMVTRIICLIVSSSLLTFTTTPTMLTDAIERLLSPLKVFHLQVHTFAMMMTLALRFIPTLIEEIDKIMNAQKARGADLESGNIVRRAKALVPILVPLFVSAFRRAYELAFAMECRCYTGGDGRTRMKQMKLKTMDYLFVLGTLLMLGGIIFLNIRFAKVI